MVCFGQLVACEANRAGCVNGAACTLDRDNGGRGRSGKATGCLSIVSSRFPDVVWGRLSTLAPSPRTRQHSSRAARVALVVG
jgi:hypothetical protein